VRFFRIPSFTGIETHRDDADRGSLRVVEGCLPFGSGGLRSGPVWKDVGNVQVDSLDEENQLLASDDGNGNSALFVTRLNEVHDMALSTTEHTEVSFFVSTYSVVDPLDLYRNQRAVISPVGNRLFSFGDSDGEAVFIGKGPPTAQASVFPDETLYSYEWSRFPNCKFFVQGPKKTLFASGNPDKPLTVYISEPASKTSPYRDAPYSTSNTNQSPGSMSTVDILGSNASEITALSTRGDQVIVHTDKGCHILYAPSADQAETGYRVEQAPATNFSAAVNPQVVGGESGTMSFWLGHDGQIYKDESATRGAEDKKSQSDPDQASWKAKGLWEKELPVDLTDSFATYDPQSGMYWIFVRSDEHKKATENDIPGRVILLDALPDAPGQPSAFNAVMDPPGAVSGLSALPDAPGQVESLEITQYPGAVSGLTAIPDAPGTVSGLSASADLPGAVSGFSVIPDVPGLVTGLTASIDAPGSVSSLSALPDVPGLVTGLTASINPPGAVSGLSALPDAPGTVTGLSTTADLPGSVSSFSVLPDSPGVVSSFNALPDLPGQVTGFSAAQQPPDYSCSSSNNLNNFFWVWSNANSRLEDINGNAFTLSNTLFYTFINAAGKYGASGYNGQHFSGGPFPNTSSIASGYNGTGLNDPFVFWGSNPSQKPYSGGKSIPWNYNNYYRMWHAFAPGVVDSNGMRTYYADFTTKSSSGSYTNNEYMELTRNPSNSNKMQINRKRGQIILMTFTKVDNSDPCELTGQYLDTTSSNPAYGIWVGLNPYNSGSGSMSAYHQDGSTFTLS